MGRKHIEYINIMFMVKANKNRIIYKGVNKT